MTQLETLQKMIDNSNKIVFFGGAGVSTESGIPDFRSETGLFRAVEEYGMPPELIVNHNFFMMRTKSFFQYYKKNLIYTQAKPNKAHIALAQLEKRGKLLAVITQNIDGLHQMAGSKSVYELHGSIHRNYCMQCKKEFDVAYIMQPEHNQKNDVYGIPICDVCGNVIKPDVVLYEEPLKEEVMESAQKAISQADLLLVGGTSLVVYPAAGFLQYYKGKDIVLINKSQTQYDTKASLIIHEPIGEVLGALQI